MKVKMKVERTTIYGTSKVGEMIEIADGEGKRLIEIGIAELPETKEKKAVKHG